MRSVLRSESGFTLAEVVIALGIFGAFLVLLTSLTAQMREAERRLPVDFMTHPQISAVLGRLRKDVLDAHGADPYLEEHDGYTQSPKTLLIESVREDGGLQKVVWDFSVPGEVRRRAYNVGVVTEWVARGLPADFSASVGAVSIDDELETAFTEAESEESIAPITNLGWAVRITAKDAGGRVAIDQILQPRAHH